MTDSISVCVAMPVYGGYHAHFVPGLLDLVRNPPCQLKIATVVGDSLVSRARNRLASRFLQTGCSHLLFLDTDLIFSAAHIARLISHRLPIVAGLYPKKQVELDWVVNTRPEFGEADPQTGLQRVLYTGTGCLLVAREVFETLARENPDLSYEPDAGEEKVEYHDFFRVGVHCDPVTGQRRYLSEDWFFCQLAADAGYQIHVDTHVVLKHCGEAIYPIHHEGQLSPAKIT